LKFSRIAPEIIKMQQLVETEFLSHQKEYESIIVDSLERGTVLTGNARLTAIKRGLTKYSVQCGELVFTRWQQLSTDIFTKFNDGYIRGADGSYPREGDPYPDGWLRRVVEEKGEQLRVPKE
jgi:hypothetical protein